MNYSCGNADYGSEVSVSCSGQCTPPQRFDQVTGSCIDPQDKPGCDETTQNPIALVTGRKSLHEIDYVNGDAIKISRDYLFDGDRGRWSFQYRQFVRTDGLNADRTVRHIGVYRENGVKYYFHADVVASSTQQAVAYEKYTPFDLSVTYDSASSPSAYVLMMPDGSQETYNSAGKLTGIKTGNGLLKTITHPTSSETKVVDETTGITLTYTLASTPSRVTKIEVSKAPSASVLLTYLYVYDTTDKNLLEQVIYPDSSTVEYIYSDINPASGVISALTSKKDETGNTWITWDYDSGRRAKMSYLGSNQAERLDIVYTMSGANLIDMASLTNSAGHTTEYEFTSLSNGSRKLKHVAGTDAVGGSCAPSDSYMTYDANQQKNTLTVGAQDTNGDGIPETEGVVTNIVHGDALWPHLITEKATGLKWASAAVKPWTGNVDPNATGTFDILPEAQKEVTSYHAETAQPTSKQYWSRNTANTAWSLYRSETYTYDDGVTATCSSPATDTYRLCSITITDELNSVDRVWAYNYTMHTATGKTMLVQTQTVNGPRTDVNDETTYTYSDKGQLTSIADAASHETSYADYNVFGLPGTITDTNNGVVTTITYDARGRVNTVTADYGGIAASTDYDYYDNGLLKKVTKPDASYLEYFYSAAHHLIRVQNDVCDHIEYEPDLLTGQWETQDVYKAGTLSGGVCAGGTLTAQYEREFDALGRLSKVKDSTGTVKKTFGYDLHDNLATAMMQGDTTNTPTHDNKDIAKVFAYDALNRLVGVRGYEDCGSGCSANSYNNIVYGNIADTAEVTYEYHKVGKIKTVTAANGAVTSYLYNGFGEVTSETSADRGYTNYIYDAGLLMESTNGRGITTYYVYDNLNRLAARYTGSAPTTIACSQTHVTNTQTTLYIYDQSGHGAGMGRLTCVVDSSGKTEYHYNKLGKVVTKIVTPISSSLALATSYEYDAAGGLEEITYPGGRTATYGRNHDRVTTVDITANGSVFASSTTTGKLVDSIVYQPFGAVASHVRGMASGQSGILTTGRVYEDGLLTELSYLETNTSGSIDLSYGYDAYDNIASINNTNQPNTSQSFEYDPMQRLSKATGLYGRYSYLYDGAGNRSSQQLQQLLPDPLNPTAQLWQTIFNETYAYQTNTNRLLTVERQTADATPKMLRKRTLAYDNGGNRKSDRKTIYASDGTTVTSNRALTPSFGYTDRMNTLSWLDCMLPANYTNAACL